MTSVQLSTGDGHTLAGDLALPHEPIGAVVVCHPHPQYGGNRFDAVVTAVYHALPPDGFAALRFDFRADRAASAGGVAERADVIAALDLLDTVEALDGVPRYVAGYSFGAAVALGVADERIVAVGAIAPPLTVMAVDPPDRPVLVLTPRHDQFSDPDATGPVVAAWADATFEVVESADHFLAGHAHPVASRLVAWLSSIGRPPATTRGPSDDGIAGADD